VQRQQEPLADGTRDAHLVAGLEIAEVIAADAHEHAAAARRIGRLGAILVDDALDGRTDDLALAVLAALRARDRGEPHLVRPPVLVPAGREHAESLAGVKSARELRARYVEDDVADPGVRLAEGAGLVLDDV